jgi:hypothetical protein
VALQGVKPFLPKPAHLLDPLRCFAQRLDIQRADPVPAPNLLAYKAGMLEHDDVLRDGVKGNGEIPGDFGNTGGALAELPQNGPTGWVGNRAEDVVERFRRTINHMVEDSSRSQDQQAVKMRLATDCGSAGFKSNFFAGCQSGWARNFITKG